MGKDATSKEKFRSAAQIIGEDTGRYVPDYQDPEPIKQRLIAASAAKQKRGKTRFGFTMPQPLCYMQLDASGEYMLDEARKRKKKADIKHLKYFADPRGDIKSANLREWERLIRDFEYNVRNFRSVLLDTATEALDVRKLAEFGRNMQIMQMYYGSIYGDFRWMVKEARKRDANVLFVHRVKDEYIDNTRTGRDILDGWRNIMYEAQVYIEHGREDNTFTTTIVECEQNALVMGLTLSSDKDDNDNDFPHLAARVFGNEPEDWQ